MIKGKLLEVTLHDIDSPGQLYRVPVPNPDLWAVEAGGDALDMPDGMLTHDYHLRQALLQDKAVNFFVRTDQHDIFNALFDISERELERIRERSYKLGYHRGWDECKGYHHRTSLRARLGRLWRALRLK